MIGARLDACAVSDALDQLGLPASVTGLASLAARGRVFGQVVTVRLAAGSPPPGAPARHLCTAAIDRAKPGDVLVVEQRTGVEAAGWGGILSNAARLKGLSGALVEGLARDVDEVLAAAERITECEAIMTKAVLRGARRSAASWAATTRAC